MKDFIAYIVMTSLLLIVFYGVYLILIQGRTDLKLTRYFLLFSIVLSFLLPLHTIRIELPEPSENLEIRERDSFSHPVFADAYDFNAEGIGIQEEPVSAQKEFSYTIYQIFVGIYFLVFSVMLIRLLINIVGILRLYATGLVFRRQTYQLIDLKKIQSSFSFFNWIFLNSKDKTEHEVENIIAHEKIHASQYHSIDILVIELIAAAMWFNPVVWIMRKELQQVHEYLADEGALGTGVDKPQYQAILLNQVAEERLIALSSGFNHSLIKKRIVMMTKPKFSRKANLKFLMIIPLTGLLFFGVACVNGQKQEGNVVAAVAPTKMNVFYLGVDNPINIAVSGYSNDELEIKVTNARHVKNTDGTYIVRPIRPGSSFVEIYSNGKLIQKTEFRVKTVPDPRAMVAGRKGGAISKEELLEAGKLLANMENFDFDLKFTITEFTLSVVIKGYVQEHTSETYNFTEDQIKLINTIESGSGKNIYFQDIIAVGPDGSSRKLPTISFRIE